MDLVLLRSLLAAVDVGTITDAADELGVSQSALSRRLQQLEVELGAELLVRGRNGVELTELGRQTVEQARGIVVRYDRLRQNICEHLGLEHGAVRIGGGATVVAYVLPKHIAEWRRDYPGIRFYVKEAGSREIASDVLTGELELGVVTLPIKARELDVSELFTDEIVLVARADHPLAKRPVRTSDLEGQPFVAFEAGSAIRQIIDNALRVAGVEIEVTMELRSIPSILKMVAATGNLAFVSRVGLSTEPELRAVAVRGLTISRTLAVVTRRGVPLSPLAAAFAATLGVPEVGGAAGG